MDLKVEGNQSTCVHGCPQKAKSFCTENHTITATLSLPSEQNSLSLLQCSIILSLSILTAVMWEHLAAIHPRCWLNRIMMKTWIKITAFLFLEIPLLCLLRSLSDVLILQPKKPKMIIHFNVEPARRLTCPSQLIIYFAVVHNRTWSSEVCSCVMHELLVKNADFSSNRTVRKMPHHYEDIAKLTPGWVFQAPTYIRSMELVTWILQINFSGPALSL